MNIEKEREAFEVWYALWTGSKVKCENIGVFAAWQAAKSQAVPKYHMENIRDALIIACDIKEDEGRFEDSLNYIHQAMIKAAQEQSHESE